MPRQIQYEGRTIEVPDDASDDFISQVLSSSGGGDPASTGGGAGATPKPLTQRINDYTDKTFANNDVPGSEALRPVGNLGRRAVRDIVHTGTDLASRVSKLGDTDTWLQAVRPHDQGPNPITARAGEFVDTAKSKGATQALTDLGGDALSMELTRGAAERVPGALVKGGNLMKKGGALTSRLTAGLESPSSPEVYGADPGAALSENHIIGTSAKSLRQRVNARIQPATEARNDVLDASTAAPVDISQDVRAPFDKATAAKTHPKTGAATPAQIQRTTTARRVIGEEVDPDSGIPTGTPKDPNLKPREISDLGANIYGMTDYTTPENSVANGALKEAGANLKDRLTQVAPESAPLTRNVHNLLEAEDELKAKVQTPQMADHTLVSGTARNLLNRAVTGAGTTAGALMDMTGNAMKGTAGALRRFGRPTAGPSTSPTAPTPPQPPAQPGPSAGHLGNGAPPSNGPTTVNWTDMPPQQGGLPGTPDGQLTSPVAPRQLPEATAPSITAQPASRTPPVNPATARNRTAPLSARIRNQQVLTDQPGFTPPSPGPTLIAGPDGTVAPVRPQLPAPNPTPALETSAGNSANLARARRPLLDRLRAEAEAHGAEHEAAIAASKAKLAGVPEAAPGPVAPEAPPPAPTPPKPASPPKGARKSLSSRVKETSPAPESGQPAPSPSAPPAFRLPAKNDMEGWMGLMDKGWAEYDSKRGEFTYTGPTNLTSRVKPK